MRVLVVTGEPIWPAHTGGRARLAGLVQALRESFDVDVHEARDGVPGWRQPLSLDPRLGRSVLRRRRFDADVVIAAHSYLAAMVDARRLVVDFANVESERYALLARDASSRAWRAVHTWERAKARRWEPAVARRAWLNVAVSDADAATIGRWGGDVVTVPSGRPDWIVPSPSPDGGPALFVCNATYPPNRDAAARLVAAWPRVRERHPGATLRIVGRATETLTLNADGVTVVGEVDDLGAEYARSSVVVAPVTTGGGTQLKVAEALAAGRAVVVTPYSARSVPHALSGACLVTDDLADVARLLGDERKQYEQVALDHPMPSWSDVAAPLVERIKGAA
jgi:glycosyltransferase involved in cell wall biosynthesis